MIKNKMKQNRKGSKVTCERQFPDCPEEMNDTDCKDCPLHPNSKW